ncbi:polyhydroxybutyrate depolymerase [uncultured Sulfitobacter sp.]|uniref:alpha/beta hydrolase family esterase n=1 Tax=uncultured Sulfitobacter sp. TaxID=191468 RepID=UPI0026026418|nr:polyhydroxybutyrate depolymerase [uncultured Sulfitobacter sp.]
MKLALLFLALLLLPAIGPWKSDCGGDVPCALGEWSYHLLAPDEWDGEAALPVLLHFHGWGRQGDLIVKHSRIATHTRNRGVLLLAPNGLGRTWDFRREGSADVDFAAAVIEDAAGMYPIDRDRIYISGYSYGAAMAWRYACDNGWDVAALLAIGGSLPQDTDCATAPQSVRHVHGLADTVMDFPLGPDGDVTYPVALWRDSFGCGDAPRLEEWQAVEWLTLERRTWECDGGTVTLDLHSGGHFIPHGWIGWQLDQLAGRAPRYP